MMNLQEWEKLDDEAAELQRFADQAEIERVNQQVERDQCSFVDAADEIHCIFADGFDADLAIDRAIGLLHKIDGDYFSQLLIRGLILQLSAAHDLSLSYEGQRCYLLAVLAAMASHDPTTEEGSEGQIQAQLKDCLDLMGSSDE